MLQTVDWEAGHDWGLVCSGESLAGLLVELDALEAHWRAEREFIAFLEFLLRHASVVREAVAVAQDQGGLLVMKLWDGSRRR